MRLPEHVAEDWAKHALTQVPLNELREAIAEALLDLELIEMGRIEIETPASEASEILYTIVEDLNSFSPEEIEDWLIELFIRSVDDALEYVEFLTRIDGNAAVRRVIREIEYHFFDAPLPEDEIVSMLAPEAREIANEISARARKLMEVLGNLRSVFEELQYREQGLTDDEVGELYDVLDVIIDKLRAIDELYLSIFETIAGELIDILKQLDKYLIRAEIEEAVDRYLRGGSR